MVNGPRPATRPRLAARFYLKPPSHPAVRICFISRRFFPTVSGMSVYAINLIRELTALGHDVTMISQYRTDEKGKAIYGGGPPPDVDGVRVIGLESKGEQSSGDFERDIDEMVDVAAQEHREQGPFDVVHAQYGYPTGLAALMAAEQLGVPSVVSIQGGDGHWVGDCCSTHREAMLAVLSHADALLIGARSFANEVTERLGTPPERFTIVPGAVDVDRFHPPEDREPGDLQEPPVFLYHGRIDARKGALDTLDAFRALLDEGHDARLRMSGIGPDADAAREKIDALGLSSHAEMTGAADYADAPAVYREADVFLSPTYAEGFSNTILEAMATGLPVVSCRAVGVVDCLTGGEDALLTEPGDTGALAEAMQRLLTDEAVRRRLARAALAEARTDYAWSTRAEQIAALYAELKGTAPDTSWTAPAMPPDDCRFRDEPALL